MKTNVLEWTRSETELIAKFGQARLVRTLDGRYELQGGSPDDHAEAREWVSLFLHEAFFRIPAGRN